MGRKNADTRSSSPTTAAIRSSRQKMDMYKVAMEKQDRERMEELERLEELQRAPSIVAEELQQQDDSTPTPRTYEDDELLEVIRGQTNLWLRRRRIRLNTDSFDVIDNLGCGSYGKVFRVTLHDKNVERAILDAGPDGVGEASSSSSSSSERPPKEFALKVLPKNYYRYKNGSLQVMAEREALLKGTHSPMIVTLYAAFQDRNNLYMLSELVPAGSLRHLMHSNKDAFTSVDLAKFCISEILLGVDAVHRLGFTHRDVKPENVVITEDGHLKLLDFGLCAEIDGLPVRDEGANWRSDAALHCSYTHLCDLWAVGIIFFEMLYKDVPFRKSPDGLTCHDKIYAFPLYLRIPPKKATSNLRLSEECKDVLVGLLTWEKSRLDFDKLKDAALFESIDWDVQHRAESPLVPIIRRASVSTDSLSDSSPPRVTPRTTRFNCNGSPLPRAKSNTIHDTDKIPKTVKAVKWMREEQLLSSCRHLQTLPSMVRFTTVAGSPGASAVARLGVDRSAKS
ncbi:protein kinase, putative [Perkinsus marinus ATCC 50983]|uniref:non-specific serine/threonine protein kinase n=1 Tax=Perkinsus marinus (strain ATCC 50983 / TXsc) TaxID=423536 RepID=C5LW14_PERM5|nr:protein kinase, putative [Perkinsus marinus ATCC 50983]EEQ99084.1 protein kinase, putative [Perkinsus marinus ATCC 50983]|eukprot:XP_002766367.1 protein kinase, putative [Perkinsus marinus ATCC 50983]